MKKEPESKSPLDVELLSTVISAVEEGLGDDELPYDKKGRLVALLYEKFAKDAEDGVRPVPDTGAVESYLKLVVNR